jgi:hypothetical protein
VFPGVHVVRGQNAEFRSVASEERHHLSSGRVLAFGFSDEFWAPDWAKVAVVSEIRATDITIRADFILHSPYAND